MSAANDASFFPACLSDPAFIAWLSHLTMAAQSKDSERVLADYIQHTQPRTEWRDAVKFLATMREARSFGAAAINQGV